MNKSLLIRRVLRIKRDFLFMNKPFYFTPLMRISIVLTVGILTAKYSYCCMSTLYWLLLSIISFAGIIAFRRNALHQSMVLYFCIFCIGCSLTSHEMDKQQESPCVKSYAELSSLDRTLLKVGEYRGHIERKFQELNIKNQDYAVITAMVLGDKTSLDKETKDAYSISGTSHVLAVSGLHIGIIFQIFILLLGGNKKTKLAIIISVLSIWSYVILIGMPASGVRSATMISIYCFALIAQKDAMSINNLCLAYCIMLLISPLYLFDISFQMSFLAVLSILVFYPSLVKILQPQNVLGKWSWNLLCVSLAAQIGTIPLVAYYFGRISCVSLLTSFVAIPSATLILYLCAIILALVPLTGLSWIGEVATYLLQLSVGCLTGITQFDNSFFRLVSLLPGASIENVKINLPMLILIYLMIILGYMLLRKAHTSKILS